MVNETMLDTRIVLGQACYEAWAQRSDRVDPLTDRWSERVKRRPRWQQLTATEQETWCLVAEAITRHVREHASMRLGI